MIFTPTQVISNHDIRLNSKIRTLLKLVNGCKIFYSLNSSVDERTSNEIIFCPYQKSEWNTIWTFKAVFNDTPGLFNRITQFFMSKNIYILNVDALTLDRGRLIKIKIDFNSSDYISEFDSDANNRIRNKALVLEELEASIIANFIHDITFIDGFNISPNLEIIRNFDLLKSGIANGYKDATTLEDDYIKLSSDIFVRIKESYANNYPNVLKLKEEEALPRCCVTTDSESSIIRAIIFFKDTGHLHFRVKYREQMGALSALSEVLMSRNINILQLNVRRLNNIFNIADFLINYPVKFDSEKSDQKLITYVKYAIEEEDKLKRDLNTEFSIPPYDQRR